MMGQRRLALGLTVIVALGLAQAPAWGIVIRSDQTDAAARLLALQPEYMSVGSIAGETAALKFSASGTLIASSWVLTAAHVVDHATSAAFTIDGVTYMADRMIAYPKWDGNPWAGYDIGLIHLSKPVTEVAPATRYHGSDELTALATSIGYGMTGTGLTGAMVFDNQKRGAQNTVDDVKFGRLLLEDFDNPNSKQASTLGSAKPGAMEGLIAPGDSGGGLFIDTPKGKMLAGVHSFVAATDGSPNSSYGDISGDTRVAAFNSWIDEVLAGMSARPVQSGAELVEMGHPDLRVTTTPEPGTLSLGAAAGLGLLLAVWVRRRRTAAR